MLISILVVLVPVVITLITGIVFTINYIATLIVGHLEVTALNNAAVWLTLATFAGSFLTSWFRRRPPTKTV